MIKLRPECEPAPPVFEAHTDDLAAPELPGGRLVLFVHLRRTDRGGTDDLRFGKVTVGKATEMRAAFEMTTARALRRLIRALDARALSVDWVVLSDDREVANATLGTILRTHTRHSLQRGALWRSDAVGAFFAMGRATGPCTQL